MRFTASFATIALAWAPQITTTNAFAPSSLTTATRPLRASSNDVESATPCVIPSEFGNDSSTSLVNANAIRSAVVTNYLGDFVRIDDAMTSGKTDLNAPQIVIFLRHMG